MSGEVYDRNRELVTKVYELGVCVADKNRYISDRLMASSAELLKYNRRLLSKLRPRQLVAMGCIRQDNVNYVYRVLQGESIDDVAKDIPVFKETPPEPVLPRPPRKKKLEDSGEFHAITRALEDGCSG